MFTPFVRGANDPAVFISASASIVSRFGLSHEPSTRTERTRSSRLPLAAIGSVLLLAQHASAALVAHYDSAAWLAAAGSVTTIDTATMPLGTLPWNPQPWAHLGFSFGDFGFTGVTAGSQFDISGATLDEVWGVAASTVMMKRVPDNFTVFLDQPTKAFSLDIANLGGIGFFAVFTDDTNEYIFLNDLPFNYLLDPVFYGVTSDKNIKQIGILVGDMSPGGNTTSYTKGFAWGTPVPAPAAGALFGMALLGARRRRVR